MTDSPPPDSAPAAPPPIPPACGLRLWPRLLLAPLFLLMLALLTLAGLLATARDDAGLTRLVRLAERASFGHFQAERATGDLWHDFSLYGLRIESATSRIRLDRLRLVWQPAALWQRTVRVDALELGQLDVDSAPSTEPATLPASLRLPLAVQVERAELARLQLRPAGVVLSGLRARLVSDGAQHRLALTRVVTEFGSGTASLTLGADKPFALAGEVRFNGRLPQLPDRPLALQARLGGSLEVLALEARLASQPTVVEALGRLRPFAPGRFGLVDELRLTAERVDPAGFFAGAPAADLSLALVTGTHDADSLTGKFAVINTRPGRMDDGRLPLENASVDLLLSDGVLQIERGHVAAGGGTLALQGGLRQGKLDLRLNLLDIDLARIVALKPTRIGGTLALGGSLAAPTLAARLQDAGRSLQLDARLQGDAGQQKVLLDALDFRDGPARLTGKGEIALAGGQAFSVEARLARLDPSRYGAFPAADLNAQLKATGAVAPLAADVRLHIDPSRFEQQPLSGQIGLRLDGERLSRADVALRLGSNQLSAQGSLGRKGDALAFVLEAPRIGELGRGFGGAARGQGRVAGSWRALEVNATLEASRVLLPGHVRVDALKLDGSWSSQDNAPIRLALDGRGLSVPDLTLERVTARLDGNRRAHRLEAGAAGRIKGLPPLDAVLAATGALGADNRWTGRIERLDNRGALPVHLSAPVELEAGARKVRLAGLMLDVLGTRLNVAEALWEPGRIQSQGRADNIRLNDLLPLLPDAPRLRTDLVLAGDWDVRLAERLDGRIRLARTGGDVVLTDPGLVRPVALDLREARLEATLAGDRLNATLGLQSARFGRLDGRGWLTLARQGGAWGISRFSTLEVTADADMPSLKWASVFAGPTTTVDGRLKLALLTRGTVGEPMLSGSLLGSGLSYKDAEQGINATDGRFTVTLGGNRLMLSDLNFKGGRGSLEGYGWLTLGPQREGGLVALEFKHFDALVRPDRNLALSGTAKVVADRTDRLLASGVLTVDRGRFDIPKGDRPRLGDDVRVSGRPPKPSSQGSALAMGVDLTIDLGEKLKLVGRGIDATLGGSLRLSGSTTAPLAATGSVKVSEGRYRAYGQNLNIERGIITFQGPLDNPGLDIVARRTGLAVEAGIALTGTAQAPRVKLVSEPNVPDNQKLAWLVLGKPTLSGGRDDAGVLLAAAGALLSDADSVPLQQQVANTFGLDEISLSARTGDTTDVETTPVTKQVVTLGKRLSERLYLSYEQGLTEATQVVKLSYQISRAWSVVTRAGDDNAVDVFYTLFFDPRPDKGR